MADVPMQTAIVYDFDGTLARGNLQECSFIPRMRMTREEFWSEVKRRAKDEDADEILVYMQLMLEKANEMGEPVSKEMLKEHGTKAELFNGLKDQHWFTRMNEFATKQGLKLEHYIISSGIEEMIRGCSIQSAFKKIYASKYIYSGELAEWPAVAINYTTKTQYLFRINKGIENHWDRIGINRYMPSAERPVPFNRMIFLGDGDTDIPSMKMVTYQGGHSVAVYDEHREVDDLDKIHRLISEGRVDFVAPANYEEKSQLDIIIKGILGRIAINCKPKSS